MNAIEGETSDPVPYDISTGDQTVVVRLDAERQTEQEDQDMTTVERELLRILEVTYTDFRKNQRTRGHAHLLMDMGKLHGLHVSLEIVATTINAKIQASLWGDKLNRIARIA